MTQPSPQEKLSVKKYNRACTIIHNWRKFQKCKIICKKQLGLKVCCKLNDYPKYDDELGMKSGKSAFSQTFLPSNNL